MPDQTIPIHKALCKRRCTVSNRHIHATQSAVAVINSVLTW